MLSCDLPYKKSRDLLLHSVKEDYGFFSRRWQRAMLCLALDRAGQYTANEVALQGEEHHQWQGH